MLFLLALGACGSEPAGEPAPPPAAAQASDAAQTTSAVAWRSAPTEGVELSAGEAVVVSTGPHAVIWPESAPRLSPPYRVRATLHKRSGRIHEGYGLVFGGERLDGPEAQQAYSYFLVRGDGSFLVRRREGTDLPILQPWTTDAAIRPDRDGTGQQHRMEIQVGLEETVFLVNDVEVARLPTADLRVSGMPGVRVAHDVTLEVRGWDAGAAAPGGGR